MKEYDITSATDEASKIALDSTLFQADDFIEGLCFIKSFKEVTAVESGREYVRIYAVDKNYKGIQINIYNINKQVTTTERLQDMVNKTAFITGTVSSFMGMNIIQAQRLDIINDNGYTEDYFIPSVEGIEKHIDKLRVVLDSIKDENVLGMLDVINNLKVPEILAKSLSPELKAKKGDSLLITLMMLEQIDSMNSFTKLEDRDFIKAFIVLCMGMFTSLDNGVQRAPQLLDNRILTNFEKLNTILVNREAFGTTYKSKGSAEFKHLYNCMYLRAEPKTFISKFFMNTLVTFKNNLQALYMDAEMIPGNSKKFAGIEHVKL